MTATTATPSASAASTSTIVIDLQTAVKELVENSIDAGATNVGQIKQYGIRNIEVIDNGSGIPEQDYESIALKHHTSKLETFTDLTILRTFGFRGEALSSLCALCETLSVTTATEHTAPMGVTLEMAPSGKVKKRSTVAHKELERNAKREFGKALALLTAYALGPCASGKGVRLTLVINRTKGAPDIRSSVSALWGPKAMDNIVDLDLEFEVEKDKVTIKRHIFPIDTTPVHVKVKGLISKFAFGSGRTGTDRQFFYVNGRPCNLSKIQKAFNEVYRSFNVNQSPFIMADFIIPTERLGKQLRLFPIHI
ncbi:histidine kinase-like ATPase [Cyathus striatus]|nr:histidine kinase-like ATPase [Cyathus striatus]